MLKLRGYIIAFSVAIFAALATSCMDTTAPDFDGKPGVIITLVFDGHPLDTMYVPVTNPVTVQKAEDFIVNGSGPHVFMGPIAKGVGYDLKYAFHFIPDGVTINDDVTAACDAAPMHSVAEVAAFVAAGTGSAAADQAQWCPSTSRPIAVSSVIKIGNPSR